MLFDGDNLLGDKGDCFASSSSSSCPTHSVDVVLCSPAHHPPSDSIETSVVCKDRSQHLGVGRYVKVDNHVNMGNVQPSAGHICCYQNGTHLALELVQSTKTFRLGNGQR